MIHSSIAVAVNLNIIVNQAVLLMISIYISQRATNVLAITVSAIIIKVIIIRSRVPAFFVSPSPTFLQQQFIVDVGC